METDELKRLTKENRELREELNALKARINRMIEKYNRLKESDKSANREEITGDVPDFLSDLLRGKI